jgi:hypothetical protein
MSLSEISAKLDHRLALSLCSPLATGCELIVVLGKVKRNAVRGAVHGALMLFVEAGSFNCVLPTISDQSFGNMPSTHVRDSVEGSRREGHGMHGGVLADEGLQVADQQLHDCICGGSVPRM